MEPFSLQQPFPPSHSFFPSSYVLSLLNYKIKQPYNSKVKTPSLWLHSASLYTKTATATLIFTVNLCITSDVNLFNDSTYAVKQAPSTSWHCDLPPQLANPQVPIKVQFNSKSIITTFLTKMPPTVLNWSPFVWIDRKNLNKNEQFETEVLSLGLEGWV